MKFLGIDIGTSFIKGALLDLEALSIEKVLREPFPDPLPNLPPLHFEVDPTTLVQSVRTFIDRMLVATPNCAGIVICSQMHGLVLTEPDGAPLTNVITWRDERASAAAPSGAGSYFDELMGLASDQERQEVGNGLRPGLPVGTLYWLQQNSQLPEQAAVPMTLPDFVLAQLCNRATSPTVEPTNAAAHGLFNVTTGDWHWGLLRKLGLDHLRWPTIVQSSHQVGCIELRGQQIPCFAPVGDHQCTLAGGFLQTDELSINISTGSQVSLLTDEPRLGPYETRPFFDGRYLNTFVKIPAGRALSALVDLLTEIPRRQGVNLDDPWQVIAEQAAVASKTNLDVDLSFFVSAGGAGQGAIRNIREDQLTVGHLFRAAFESMAENYALYASKLASGVGAADAELPWRQIVFSGGVVQKNKVLRQLIAETIGCGYRVAPSAEDSLLGLLALALVASGEVGSVTEATELLLERDR